MSIRTLALASALSLGLSSAAMAQAVVIDTPAFGFSAGVYDPYYYGPPTYLEPGYMYSPRLRGDRADEDIHSGFMGGPYLQDDYENQTGVNTN